MAVGRERIFNLEVEVEEAAAVTALVLLTTLCDIAKTARRAEQMKY